MTVSGGWMRKRTSEQNVSYWVRIVQEQAEREREERMAPPEEDLLEPEG